MRRRRAPPAASILKGTMKKNKGGLAAIAKMV
jgi:hypothetical protein